MAGFTILGFIKENLMRIAQVAPLWECVPPPAYGGIELVVSLLTDELVRRGHEVTLFASGDSTTLAQLESVYPRALRLDDTVKEYGMYELLNLSRVFEQAGDYDIIHSHVGCAALPLSQVVKTPVIHTLHGVFTPDARHMFHHARQQPYVSISDAQIEPELGLNIVSTVYNGIDVTKFKFHAQADQPQYLAFLGRMSPEKGPHHAIAIAKATGIPLRMAGKVDPIDREFFETQVLPHIDGEFIKFQGEANHAQKNELMGRAVATLFPITWREPFGLVMVEALATGSPVVAMALGSVPEIITHGKVGFQCDTVDQCVEAVKQVGTIDRATCRQHVQDNFSASSMTTGYEAAYRKLLNQQFAKTSHRRLATVS
jgi:glycosyltransferase involved in cell wall biosynthesis